MSLRFPSVDEIPLASAPVAEVICQVRFPPILRIGSEPPSELQDRIRGRFPKYETVQEIAFAGITSSADLKKSLQPTLHNFKTKDGQTKATLGVNFFALTENQYRSWEHFKGDLTALSQGVMDLYSPFSATRIGLRYVNKLSPGNTGLEEIHELTALLNEKLATPFMDAVWGGAEAFQAKIISSGNGAKIAVRYAVDPEPFVLIDLDYFEEGDDIPLHDLGGRLDDFHEVVYSAFRWCIKDEALDLFKRGNAGK